MAPLVESSLAAGRNLLARAVDALPHLVAREKPIQTKKMTGIIIGVVGGVLILVTLTLILIFHRRRSKRDDKEDAALQMELDGDFDDDAISQPRPTRHRPPRTHDMNDDGFKQRQPSVCDRANWLVEGIDKQLLKEGRFAGGNVAGLRLSQPLDSSADSTDRRDNVVEADPVERKA